MGVGSTAGSSAGGGGGFGRGSGFGAGASGGLSGRLWARDVPSVEPVPIRSLRRGLAGELEGLESLSTRVQARI